MRIDVPLQGDPSVHGWETHFYSGSAIFSIAPASEAACLKINKPYQAPSRLALTYTDEDETEGTL